MANGSRKIVKWVLSFVLIITVYIMNAQEKKNNVPALDAQQVSMANIATQTAIGNIDQLKVALNAGLDAGLTVNEIKEALVQLYAYCGFPRSLNAIDALIKVLQERKLRGIQDVLGKEGEVNNTVVDKYEQGRKILET